MDNCKEGEHDFGVMTLHMCAERLMQSCSKCGKKRFGFILWNEKLQVRDECKNCDWQSIPTTSLGVSCKQLRDADEGSNEYGKAFCKGYEKADFELKDITG